MMGVKPYFTLPPRSAVARRCGGHGPWGCGGHDLRRCGGHGAWKQQQTAVLSLPTHQSPGPTSAPDPLWHGSAGPSNHVKHASAAHGSDDGPPAGAKSNDGPPAGTQSNDGPPAGTQSNDGPPAGDKSDDGPPAGVKPNDGPPADAQSDDGPPAGVQCLRNADASTTAAVRNGWSNGWVNGRSNGRSTTVPRRGDDAIPGHAARHDAANGGGGAASDGPALDAAIPTKANCPPPLRGRAVGDHHPQSVVFKTTGKCHSTVPGWDRAEPSGKAWCSISLQHCQHVARAPHRPGVSLWSSQPHPPAHSAGLF